MNYFKDYFERQMLTVRSMELLEEMKSVIRDMGGISAHGRNKDDRVIATALATVAFAEQVMPRLMALRVTRSKREEQEVMRDEPVMQKSINNYLKAIGV